MATLCQGRIAFDVSLTKKCLRIVCWYVPSVSRVSLYSRHLSTCPPITPSIALLRQWCYLCLCLASYIYGYSPNKACFERFLLALKGSYLLGTLTTLYQHPGHPLSPSISHFFIPLPSHSLSHSFSHSLSPSFSLPAPLCHPPGYPRSALWPPFVCFAHPRPSLSLLAQSLAYSRSMSWRFLFLTSALPFTYSLGLLGVD